MADKTNWLLIGAIVGGIYLLSRTSPASAQTTTTSTTSADQGGSIQDSSSQTDNLTGTTYINPNPSQQKQISLNNQAQILQQKNQQAGTNNQQINTNLVNILKSAQSQNLLIGGSAQSQNNYIQNQIKNFPVTVLPGVAILN